jgi:hypothetical protein
MYVETTGYLEVITDIVVKEHSWNTQPTQRHTVPEAVNSVKVEGS